MRINLPVTQQSQEVPDDSPLLSTTDTTARITYANDAFISISGFTLDELIGEPHNIVRHPDMPPQAFEDMWRSLKSGQTWTALVKNRCKNGDHYWVLANASPMVRNGRLTGYISVRTKPTATEIVSAGALYRRFLEGRAGRLAFHCGLIVHTGVMRWASAHQLMPTAWRVRLPLLLSGAISTAVLACS